MKKHKILKIAVLSLAAVLLSSIGGFFVYASDYYHADETALAVLNTSDNIAQQDNLLVLSPDTPSNTTLIFYPGAKVEYTAYLPLLEKIVQQCDITCILVKMPFNMAIFDVNAAEKILPQFPDIKNWYIGGHSMGGAMASSYASKHAGEVKGLILLGAYIYGGYPAENALTVYGTFNLNLEKNINYTENIIIIDGGNHAQFGNYGKQKGDPDATITSEEQQDITVAAIDAFLKNR